MYPWMRNPSPAEMWNADISAIESGFSQGRASAIVSADIVATSTSKKRPGSRSL